MTKLDLIGIPATSRTRLQAPVPGETLLIASRAFFAGNLKDRDLESRELSVISIALQNHLSSRNGKHLTMPPYVTDDTMHAWCAMHLRAPVHLVQGRLGQWPKEYVFHLQTGPGTWLLGRIPDRYQCHDDNALRKVK